jgi:YfiH family protein
VSALFLESPLLGALGIEHGFGLRGSDAVPVTDLWRARQVHGTRLVERPGPASEEADALFTRRPGLAVGVQTADCVPLLLAHEGGGGVAALHAGWRGTAAGMARLAVGGLCRELDVAPGSWLVVIGPHIGPCCYEVDEPVREAVGDGVHLREGRPGHYQLDLFELNRAQLLAAGVPAKRIGRVGGCTMCDPERYPSFRRDGTAARMVHWIRCR